MRKNKMMRAASALLVAVLLTTSTISGTFAKYVTTSEAKDEARVAKWGVELQVVGNLFGEAYENDVIADEKNNTIEFEVKASSEPALDLVGEAGLDDLVAPGTKNDEGFTFSLKGTPEVAGRAIIEKLEVQNIFLEAGQYGVILPVDVPVNKANFDEFEDLYYLDDDDRYKEATAWLAEWDMSAPAFFTLEDYVNLNHKYYPVVFKLAGGTTYDGDIEDDTLYNIADAIAKRVNSGATFTQANATTTYTNIESEIFDPNTDLADVSSFNLDDEIITWAWKFENGTGADEIKKYNGADTILGMLERETDGKVVVFEGAGYREVDNTDEYTLYCIDLKFELKLRVEQIDKMP